jgi:hypothetical protein
MAKQQAGQGNISPQNVGSIISKQAKDTQYRVPAVPFHTHNLVDSPGIVQLVPSPTQDADPSSNILYIGGFRVFTGPGLAWDFGVTTRGKFAQNAAILELTTPAVTAINGSAYGSNTTIPSAADTAVSLTNLEFNNGLTYSNPTFTTITAGQYLVTGCANFSASTSGALYKTMIFVNGSAVAESAVQASANGLQIGACVSKILDIPTPANIQLYAWQNSGSAQSLYSTSAFTYLSVAKV